MTNQDHDQKKRECFVQFCKDNGIDQEVNISIFDAFDQIFDRAYAIGKQFGNSDFSDAEEEGMLTVSRKRVREMYAANERIKADSPDKETAHISDHINHVLKHLFGSKCLLDEVSEVKRTLSENLSEPKPAEPKEVAVAGNATTTQKPAEPKYHKGEKVIYNGAVHRIVVGYGDGHYLLNKEKSVVHESDLEPYTEPKKKRHVSVKEACEILGVEEPTTLVRSVDKHFDTILKDSFRNERRLNIAAQIVASMVGSDDWTTWRGGSNKEIWHNMAKSSLEIADALISECKKG